MCFNFWKVWGSNYESKLHFFAPSKQKKVRYNSNCLMTRKLIEEIMIRSKLRNKFNKSRTSVNLENYKKQRNKCTKVLRNANSNTLRI